MRTILVAGLGLSLMLASSVAFSADEAKTTDKKEVKVKLTCPVSGKAIDKTKTSEYGGGKVCFCCANCKAAFDADNAKFATKANLQLAASGQAKQTKCPFSGEGLNESTAVKVSGVSVQFCCDDCKAKVVAAEKDKQLEMVFGAKAFSKAFKVAAKEKEEAPKE